MFKSFLEYDLNLAMLIVKRGKFCEERISVTLNFARC